MFEVRTNWQ